MKAKLDPIFFQKVLSWEHTTPNSTQKKENKNVFHNDVRKKEIETFLKKSNSKYENSGAVFKKLSTLLIWLFYSAHPDLIHFPLSLLFIFLICLWIFSLLFVFFSQQGFQLILAFLPYILHRHKIELTWIY